MNCYIVRIYREEANNPRQFVGTVEAVGEKNKLAFTNIDELWEIMNPAHQGSQRSESEMENE